VKEGYDKKEIEAVKKNMNKFEEYIIAGCARFVTGKYVSYLECLSNRGDIVATLGHLFPKLILRPIWRNTWNRGIIYEYCTEHIEKSQFSHYLDQIENGLFSESKLVKDYWLMSLTKKEV
jgi:hypothetical protein